MRVLVLSDSHSSLRFMRFCVRTFAPEVVIHLGDHYEDGEALADEFYRIRFYQVPGNCDHYRNDLNVPETLVENIEGVKIFMTHGHRHGVKMGLSKLISDARSVGADAVLFGHTHESYCEKEGGMWIVNPGSCGYHGGSAALMIVSDGKISDCRIFRQSDMYLST